MDWLLFRSVIFVTIFFADVILVSDAAAAQQQPFVACGNNVVSISPGQTKYVNTAASGYRPGSSCRYQINGPKNSKIQVSCKINMIKSQNCNADRFYIDLNGNPSLSTSLYYCGQQTITKTSNGNQLTLAYISTVNSGTFQCTLTATSTSSGPSGPSATSAAPPASTDSCDCGWNSNMRIVGGSNASPGEFPSMAGLVSASSGQVFCGATIIAPNYVLTAAHCLTSSTVRLADTGVLVGDTDLSTGSDGQSVLIPASQFIVHPKYVPSTGLNDIALVLTRAPITFTRSIAPACLPFLYTSADFSNTQVTVTGWGSTEFGGKAGNTKILQKVSLGVLTNSNCNQAYPNIVPSEMCTYTANKDACQLDSGGPLFFRAQNQRLFHVGIVSAGNACATSSPGINTRTTSYLDWITTIIDSRTLCRKSMS